MTARLLIAAALLLPVQAAPAHAGQAQRHARCIAKPYPGERWCPAEWAARPSFHRSSRWYIPEAWLRYRLGVIAWCESRGNPRATSAGGTYRGKYQWHPRTWVSQGGRGDPAAAPENEQDWRAAKLYRAAGPAPWPVCGR